MSPRHNRRRYKRRARFGFLYKLLAVIAMLAAVVMGATVFFRVEEMVVTGNQRYTAAQIIDATGIVQGDNLFGMNKFETARQIRRQLPYVEGVNIRRGWPDTLIITVTECEAAARVTGEKGQWLISRSGKVLELARGITQNVIAVEGLNAVQPESGLPLVVREEQQIRGDALLSLLNALEQCGMLKKVTYIDMTSPSRILMDFDVRFTVKLPVNGDFNYLLGAMGQAVDTLEDYETGTLDLTVKDYTVVFSPD
ncbi:MAG: FtsQ-type POTRA domain-containing protein [Oscillospiraceae bacterium]|nr:FtsQ-type POTRA domain-containing protein [Oscillospiraceae bacterium]